MLQNLKKIASYLLPLAWGAHAFLAPITASASGGGVLAGGFFSLLSKTATPAFASNEAHNSQTVPLLVPALNFDPKPSIGGGDIALAGGVALVSEVGPSGTAADIEHELPEASAISVYMVHEGDTLGGIAKMFGVPISTIMWANDLTKGTIRPGQTLVILPIAGVRHTVVKDDTVASIAKKYNANKEEILSYNDLQDGESLALGTTVIVPDGEVVPPSAPKERSSTTQSTLRGVGGPNLGTYYRWPVDGGVVTQGLHGYNGVDIGATTGTTIFASAAGIVLIANGGGGWNGGYGNYVVIQHDNGTQTLYAHMSKVSISAGVRVGQGATIGTVGRTGKSTGSHLHFEVRGAVNPFTR